MKNLTQMILLALVIAALVTGAVLYKARKSKVAPDGPALMLDLGKGVTLELVRIEPGEFEMGSDESEPGHDPSESPRHKVSIAKPFYLGKYEVTQTQYEAIMGFNQAQLKGPGNQACDSLAWSDAQKFCKYASERVGRVMRLPSEAEWEYACRAGTTTPFAFGDQLTKADAVFNWSKVDEGAGSPTHPAAVGSGKANAWGLYDMHGNLCEWCQDVFTPDYSKPADAQKAPAADADFVYRGGSWRQGPEECRSAVRFAGAAELRSDRMGFRIVVEPR